MSRPGAEAEHVLRHECAGLVVEERDADVAAGDGLRRQLPDHLAELHREQGAPDVAHDLGRALEHPVHVLGGVLLQHLA